MLLVSVASVTARPDDRASLPIRVPELHSLAQRPAAVQDDGDTLYVGYTPGSGNPLTNVWSISAGRGPGFHRAPTPGGMWTFDAAVNADSAQGWWSIRHADDAVAPSVADDLRPWMAIDAGNQANYRPSGPGRRTFGVVGVWHSDPGSAAFTPIAGTLPQPLSWSPISGTRSAWCGLRGHGDVSVIDPVTGTAFNEDVLQYDAPIASGVPNVRAMPGYASQWDQLLYRDVVIPNGSNVFRLQFDYRTALSTTIDNSSSTKTGWFHGDPLATVAGNFISATAAGVNAPRDSFMVYIGVPVNDAACLYSDGTSRPVYDPQRRWFSEVVRLFDGSPFFEVFSTTGTHLANAPVAITLPASAVTAIRTSGNGNLRVVFRVKTNRVGDDENGTFSSGTSGAAMIDNVQAAFGAGGLASIGDFEGSGPGSIDNRNTVAATAAWKSTGKPPAVYPHVHDLSSLVYDDPNGPPGSPNRTCDLWAGVVSAGDHDQGEGNSGLYESELERFDAWVSPTIQLCGPFTFPGHRNAMGISPEDLAAATEWLLDLDVYDGLGLPNVSGTVYQCGLQCYPVSDRNGRPGWGQARFTPFLESLNAFQCIRDLVGLKSNGLVTTSNPSGIPDSVRLVIRKRVECSVFGATVGCQSADGMYWDNVSLDLVRQDAIPLPPDSCTGIAWRQTASTGPAARSGHAMSTDDADAWVYLFGGTGTGGTALNDLWEWDGTHWLPRPSLTSPGPRTEMAMAFDGQRRKLIVFGGRNGTTRTGDTWSWDGTDWTQVASTGPSARSGAAMCYDALRDRIVLFGGNNGSVDLNDTWEWNGTAWSLVSSSGPPARRRAGMAYDTQRARVCLYGGRAGVSSDFGDALWEWDGSTWAHQTPEGNGSPPPASSGLAFCFSGANNMCMVYGGNPGTNPNRTWFWDGADWVGADVGIPGGRADAACAFDLYRGKPMLFGGLAPGNPNPLGDTWEFCCLCDDQSIATDASGNPQYPAWADTTQGVETVDDSTAAIPETQFGGGSADDDEWPFQFLCDPSVGGFLPPGDPLVAPDDSLSALLGVPVTQQAVLDSAVVWDSLLTALVPPHRADSTLALKGVVGNGVYHPSGGFHCPDPHRNYIFGGRDIIFVHGFKKEHIDQLDSSNPHVVPWIQPTAFPASTQNPEFYSGYFKQVAIATWDRHIRHYLQAHNIANRYLIVAWPSTEHLDVGAVAILTQISDAMRYGTGVVNPVNPTDVLGFGEPSFVVVSHSLGCLATDIAMTAARDFPNLNAQFIPQHCKAHLTLDATYEGSRISTVALALHLPLFAAPPWLCPLVGKINDIINENAGSPTPTCQQVAAIGFNSVLLDMVPGVSRLIWSPFVAKTPIRTVDIMGGHPTFMWPLKFLNPGLDDGFPNANSMAVNPNPVLFWPSGILGFGPLFPVRTFDLGRTLRHGEPLRSYGLFHNQIDEPYQNPGTRLLNLIPYAHFAAEGASPAFSPTGMVQPRGVSLPGFDSRARYASHLSFVQSPADHFRCWNGTRPIPDEINNDYYPSILGTKDFVIYQERNREETRVIRKQDHSALFDRYATTYPWDDQPLLTTACAPGNEIVTEGRYIRLPFRFRGKKAKLWIWKRHYGRIHGWEDETAVDIAYASLLQCDRGAWPCDSTTGLGGVPVGVTRAGRTYPNPFRVGASIDFALGDPAPLRVEIIDVSGRVVRHLWNGRMAAGEHTIYWDARSDAGERLRPGVYFWRMRSGRETIVRNLIRIE